MRESEVLGLTWEDVDLEGGTIHVRQALYQRKVGDPLFKDPKFSSRRVINISKEVVQALKEHEIQQKKDRLAFGEGYVNSGLVCCMEDGSIINPGTLSSVFKNKAAKLGLSVSFHDLRHSHASLMMKAGVPVKVVSERLGHSQINITQDLYTHVLPGMQEEAAKKFEALLNPKKKSVANRAKRKTM